MPRDQATEDEPLLGRPGDVTQHEGSLVSNLVIGTAVLAQAGIWILAAIIWAGVLENDLILFSAHPLLNSVGLLLATQAILILQPTSTPAQKAAGTRLHLALHGVGLVALLAGLVVIEYNKVSHNGAHFGAAHNILGLITYILLVIQAAVGITQYYTPSLYGGEEKAKAVWKYHRISGYAVLIVGLATVCASTKTDYNLNVSHIKLWAATTASVLVVLGVLPRVKLQKLGVRRQEEDE